MKGRLKILIYGNADECKTVEDRICGLPFSLGRSHEFRHASAWDDMEREVVEWMPDLVMVIADGAAGMEGVYLAKARKPDVPVCWFSDDYDFGMQSHRLDCVYFSTKPITDEKLGRAFARYTQMY